MNLGIGRRRNALFLILPIVAVAVIGFGFALDRWVVVGDIETVPEPAAISPPAPTTPPASQTEVDDAHFEALFARGIAGLRAGKPDQAAAAFEAAQILNPRVPALHANLGFARLALGKINAAIESFETSTNLRPAQANAYFGLAEAWEKQGDLEQALGAMRTFVHLTPEDDPFRRRAFSAIWEWEQALGRLPSNAAEAVQAETGGQAGARGQDLLSVDLNRLDGGSDTFARFIGKTVILNVWATWCAPCRVELPSLQRLSKKLDPTRYAVVGLSTDEDPDYVREFLRDVGVDYPNYLDSGRDITYGILKIESYPQTLLIRPDGSIVQQIVGARAWDEPGMIANITGAQ